MATRSQTRAVAATPPPLPLISEHGALLHEGARAPSSSQFPPPDALDDEVWLPGAALDDVDDGGDLEYFMVLASAAHHGIRADQQHVHLAALGQYVLATHEYHDDEWQPVAMCDDVDDIPDREYFVRLDMAIIDWQEEERRVRLAAMVRQAAAEDSVPLLERACVICMDALGATEHGPVVQLDCHASHRFHAECLARAWAGRASRPCPCYRRPSPMDLSLASCQQWRSARRAHDEHVANEWEAHSVWRDMPPCVAAVAPPCTLVLDHTRVPGEWHAIDCMPVISCVLSPCNHVSDVPSDLRVEWARARSEVLHEVRQAREQNNSSALERGLKWHLCLHDVLLRVPRRGTRGGSRTAGVLEARFSAWRAGARERLLQWWVDDRRRASSHFEARAGEESAVFPNADERERRQADVALRLIREGEMSRALRALHSLGAAGVTPAVLAQLRRKHPPSDMHVPAVIPGLQASRISVELTDTFRQLRRRAGCGPSGHRNEYLRALVGSFRDSVADNVMEAYNGFAMAFVNAELPDWYYQAAAVARLLPLVKGQTTPPHDAGPRGGGPDVRPIAVGEVEVRAVTRHVTDAVLDQAGGVLSPQQLAVGVKGGTSILVHGVRMLLEHNPSFVVVRMDLANAYNAISRVVVLRRLASRPEFTHLVPLLQVLWGAGTALHVGVTQRRLFDDGTPRADSAEGVQQGCPLSSLAFAVGIHPELQGLDAELAPFDGAARAIMDDIYAVGPPSVVFPAVQRFRLTLRLLTGLVSNIAKFVCFSHQYDLEGCPWRADAQVPLGGDQLGGGKGDGCRRPRGR